MTAALNNVVLAESEVPSVHFSGSGKVSKNVKVPTIEKINTEADEEIATVKGSPYLNKEPSNWLSSVLNEESRPRESQPRQSIDYHQLTIQEENDNAIQETEVNIRKNND